jgi:hypothetical protein
MLNNVKFSGYDMHMYMDVNENEIDYFATVTIEF